MSLIEKMTRKMKINNVTKYNNFMKQVRRDIKIMSPKKFNKAYPIARKANAAKFLKNINFTKHIKTINTSIPRLGGVVGAAAYGAYRIGKAHKAAVKEIGSQHSPARNKAHRDQIKAIRAQGDRRRARQAAARIIRRK